MDTEKVTPSNIGIGTWMVLIGIALFFDLLEDFFFPIAFLIDPIAFAIFWLIFKMNGEKYSKKTMIAGAIIGFIPIVNMLPECTVTIVKLYIDAKAKNALAKRQEQNNVLPFKPRIPRRQENPNSESDDLRNVA
jgi:hypothetical protein